MSLEDITNAVTILISTAERKGTRLNSLSLVLITRIIYILSGLVAEKSIRWILKEI